MANHGFLTSRKTFKPDRVFECLNEINQRRFKGTLIISYDKKGSSVDSGLWNIAYSKSKHSESFNIWIVNKNKLETRHTQRSDFMWWVKWVLWDELAFSFNGTISDEGIEEKWKGQPNKYPTFSDYIDASMELVKTPLISDAMIAYKIHSVPRRCPKELVGKYASFKLGLWDKE